MDTNLITRVGNHFEDSIATKQKSKDVLAVDLARAIELMFQCVNAGAKILACGNGGSAADAQHFAAELVGRFERERKELGAIALTTDSSILTAVGNDYGYDEIFSKQVSALGKAGDILLAISTSGNSKNVIKAIEVAKSKGIAVIALTGKDGGAMGKMIGAGDIHLCVPADRTARIQETHLLILHCLCDGIDYLLLG
ncbi:phosphoheptose isomerase [Polynucleobacter rarus]|jgi:D-sedoheptulose 7-phosphate isomerase|uniref:phosphoheptose isomerase n=1 Tax=Polynucleobacter rarus TaxID=556055 RepID=UPI000D3EBFE8|nr:phosphoheptose isomerase [Polynucleobacter rarus]